MVSTGTPPLTSASDEPRRSPIPHEPEAATVDREEVLDFLGDLLAHYTSYHNHKDAMAWAGVVLYSGLSFAFISAMKDRAGTHDPLQVPGAILLIWLLITCFTFCA